MKRLLKKIQILSMTALALVLFFSCQKDDAITTGTPLGNASIPPDKNTSELPDVSHFPGAVGKDVPRVENNKVTLHLDYHSIGANSGKTQTKPPRFSVGLYAAPDDTIKVSVPQGTKGLSIQIGAWTDTVISHLPNTVIASRMELKEGNNIILSRYGGPIYILASSAISDPVTLTFSGAVKEPDFVLGKTSPFAWWDSLQTSQVPWLELRSDNMILTVPKDKMLEVGPLNPAYLLTAWDHILNHNFYEWSGFSADAKEKVNQQSDMPKRIIFDSRTTQTHAGYPVVFPNKMSTFSEVMDEEALKAGMAWDVFYQVGMNFQQYQGWIWEDLETTAAHLFILNYAHEKEISLSSYPQMNTAFPKALAYAETDGEKQFDTDFKNPVFKLLPFVQIFETAGYDFMPYISKKARQLDQPLKTTLDKHDFFYETLCEFTKKDWKLFFRAWGIHLSKAAINKVYNENNPLLLKEKWTYNPLTDTGGTIVYHPYDNKNWSIVDFSSQIGENTASGSGFALDAIDGDINTYWHSNWYKNGIHPPHFITVDMKLPLEVSKFYFYQRQADKNENVRIKKVDIKVSMDGDSWTDVGSFHLDNTKDKQVVSLDEAHTFRYFKIIVPTAEDTYFSNENDFAALAEVGVIE